MGLFDLFKKTKVVDPEEQERDNWSKTVTMEEYLQAAESKNILRLVQNVIKLNFDYDNTKCVPVLEAGWFRESLHLYLQLPWALCLMSGVKANAEELLKLLESRGDCPNAAFYLGVFYEIGLLIADDNAEEAKRHYNIASTQGSRLAIVLEALRPKMSRKQNLIIDEKEALVVNLNPLNLEMNHNELFKSLTEQDITDLRFVYTVGLGHLTNLGYPCATMFLASPMIKWKNEITQGKTVVNIFTKGVNQSCGEMMCKRLIKSAREGNTYAIAALKNFNIDYRYNYS